MANWSWESALGDRRSIPFDRAGAAAGLLLSQFPVSAGLRPQLLQTRRKSRNHRFLAAFFTYFLLLLAKSMPPEAHPFRTVHAKDITDSHDQCEHWSRNDNFSIGRCLIIAKPSRKKPRGNAACSGRVEHKSAQGPRTGGIFTPSVRGSFGQAIQGCRT